VAADDVVATGARDDFDHHADAVHCVLGH
jgi:hypothetical protein